MNLQQNQLLVLSMDLKNMSVFLEFSIQEVISLAKNRIILDHQPRHNLMTFE